MGCRFLLIALLLLAGGGPAVAGPGDPASRIAARFAICGPPADNLGNTAWAACAAAVDDMYGKDQPGSAPPAPAAGATRAERVWVNGRLIPTCSHGGLCHGRLMEALQHPAR